MNKPLVPIKMVPEMCHFPITKCLGLLEIKRMHHLDQLNARRCQVIQKFFEKNLTKTFKIPSGKRVVLQY